MNIVYGCITHNCQNYSDRGEGRIILVDPDDDGWICEACWHFLTTGDPSQSQLYRNARPRYDNERSTHNELVNERIDVLRNRFHNDHHDDDNGMDDFYEDLNYDYPEEYEPEENNEPLEVSEALQRMISSMNVKPVSLQNEVNQTLIDLHT